MSGRSLGADTATAVPWQEREARAGCSGLPLSWHDRFMGIRQWARDFDQSKFPLPEHLTRLAEPLLEPGETIQHLFAGISNAWWGEFWVGVVTDRSILVIDACPGLFYFLPLSARSSFRLPRKARLGPRFGKGWYVIDGKRVFVADPAYQAEIAAADAEMGFAPVDEPRRGTL